MSTASSARAQSCSFYLNATDGDDGNNGTSPQAAVGSFEYAFRTFPSDAVVCMTGGEYFHGPDADGIQLSGSEVSGKNMRFVLQSFGGIDEVSFTEDELRVDIGSGIVEFVAGSTRKLRFGRGVINSPKDFPANTTFLHSLVLASGTLRVTAVDLAVGASVGNPGFVREGNPAYAAPDSAAIGRGTGILDGSPAFESATRALTYIGSGDRSTGNEVPPLINRVTFKHEAGTVVISGSLPFGQGSVIELVAGGDARFTSQVSLSNVSSRVVTVSGSGELNLSGGLSLDIAASVADLVRLSSDGSLRIAGFTVSRTSSVAGTVTASAINSGAGLLSIQNANTGSSVALTLRNENGGTLKLGSPASSTLIRSDVMNYAGGSAEMEGGTVVTGDIVNDGQLTILGALDFSSTITNRGIVDIEAPISVTGTIVNVGDVNLGPFAMTITAEGPHENAGRILSNGGGLIELASSTSILGAGILPTLRSATGTHVVSATGIQGDVEILTGAQLTLDVDEITGDVDLNGGTASLTAVSIGSLSASAGSLTFGSDITVSGVYFQQATASVDLGSHLLSLKGAFERIGGALTTNGGGLRFSGSAPQTFAPGPGFSIDKLEIAAPDVALASGPVDILDSLVVRAGSRLSIFDHQIRLVGELSAAVVEGEIQTGISGALVFGGSEGALHTLSGAGLIGNVEIAFDGEDDVVLVTGDGVRQGGILTLTSGVLRVAAGSTYSLVSTQGVPSIRRNLSDGDGDGEPSGKAIEANTPTTGSFLSPEQGYNLEYFGTLSEPTTTGRELVSGRIIALSIRIDGGSGNAGTLVLSEDLSFSGALDLTETATIQLGSFDLTSTGDDLVHGLPGRVEATDGAFVVLGSNVTVEASADSPSTVENLRIESGGQVRTHMIRSIAGMLEVVSGELDLGIRDADSGAGDVRRMLVRSSAVVTLLTNVRIIEEVTIRDGELDLDRFNLVMMPGASFGATDGAKFAETRTGEVVFTGSGSISTGTSRIPKLRIAPPSESRLSLTGDVRISESFMLDSGILDLATNTLTFEGGVWEESGGQIEGSGAISIAGDVDAIFATDFSIPNLTVQTSSSQTGLSMRSASQQRRNVTVNGLLDLREGLVDLGLVDLTVGRPGVPSFLEYEKGVFKMITGAGVGPDESGELVLSDTEIALDGTLSLPNVRISGSSRFQTESAPLFVEQQITLGKGSLNNTDSTLVRLADGVRIVRNGPGTFQNPPSLDNSVDVFYKIRGVAIDGNVLLTSVEMPAPGALGILAVDAGTNILRLSKDVLVEDTLRLESGTLDRNGFGLRVANAGTVHYDHSSSQPPSFAGGSFEPTGPVRLVFSGTMDLSSTDLLFPDDISVSELAVETGSDDADAGASSFILHGNRRISNLTVNARNGSSGFDLNGRTLLVDSDVRVNAGIINSTVESILEVGDSLLVEPNGAVRGVVSVTVRGDAEIAGVFDGFLLRLHGNMLVSGSLGSVEQEPSADADIFVPGVPNVEFSGRDQIVRFERADEKSESIDDAVNRLIMSSTGVVRLAGSGNVPFTLGVNTLVLRSGLLETGLHDVRLPSDGSGFEREESASSHVSGRISRTILAGVANTYDFPVGSSDALPAFRPVLITFSEADPPTTATILTVGHGDAGPHGYLGLPIDGGQDVLITDASEFNWSLSAVPAIPATQTFTLGVVGSGFDAFSAGRSLRLVRRTSGIPWENSWKMQGSALQYDNAIVNLDDRSAPFVQAVHTSGGIPSDPEAFAIGIDAPGMNFARLQVANLLGTSEPVVDVFVDDSSAASGLAFGEATPYFRSQPGPREVRLMAQNGAVIVRDTLLFEAGRDYLVAAVIVGRHGQPSLTAREAQAIPDLDDREDVSVAFFHGIPDAPPLSLRTRGDLEVLFHGIPFTDLSDDYAALPPVNFGFDVLTSSTSETLLSIRSDLDGHAGETINIFAAGYLDPTSYGGSRSARLYMFTNHGLPISTGVQVAAEEATEVPATFALHGNYPNPFNPSTSLVIDLPESAEVNVEVFDLLGRSVMRTSAGALVPGRQTILIDAGELPSGVYVYRVVAIGSNRYAGSGKMTLVR